jgi:hypothetical protein
VTIYDIDNVVLYLWYYYVMFQLLFVNPIILIKSFAAIFPLQREKCFRKGCVLEGHGWDSAPWDQLLVN